MTANLFHDDWANGYDARVRAVIPGYETVHDLVAVELGRALPERARVLVAGCGTGMELCGLAGRHPGWTFTGADPSPDMLAIARRRVAEAALSGRVALHECPLERVPAGAPHDAAVSVLVMQFLPDDGAKGAYLKALAGHLAPGGLLVLVDGEGDPGSAAHARNLERWKAYAVLRGLSPDYVERDLQQRRDNWHMVPEARTRELLAGAGFDAVERFYQAFHIGGLVARLK